MNDIDTNDSHTSAAAVGNQVDIIESSLCQSSNIEINTSMVGLSYLKIRPSETNLNVEKIY